jgi:signal peptidase I
MAFKFKYGQVLCLSNPYTTLTGSSSSKSYTVIKRVTGLPGDIVVVPNSVPGAAKSVTVPDGHVWVEGDNKDASRDSREYGPVPVNLVIGIVRGRIYPKPRWLGEGDDVDTEGKCKVYRVCED